MGPCSPHRGLPHDADSRVRNRRPDLKVTVTFSVESLQGEVMNAPSGWYPDPAGSGRQRYFDGSDWTDHFAPAPSAGPAVSKNKPILLTVGIIGLVLAVGIGLVVVYVVANRPGAMNEAVADGDFTFEVTGIQEVAGTITSHTPRGRYVIVDVTVVNHSDREQTFQVDDQVLIGSNGAEYGADWLGAASINNENTLLLNLGPGFSAKYRLPFDLPVGVKPDRIELHDSSFSGGTAVKLPE